MKVFLSWSGEGANYVARTLRDWLPMVINSIEPWMSSEDLSPGERWSSEIARQLDETSFGIICLTHESMDAPWVLFEAGVLAKSMDKPASVVPYLVGPSKADLTGPLSQFQAVIANKGETLKLILALHKSLERALLTEAQQRKAFDTYWPELEAALGSIPQPSEKTVARDDREILEEILEIVRNRRRRSTQSETRAQFVFIITSEGKPELNCVWQVPEHTTVQQLLDGFSLHRMRDLVPKNSYGQAWELRHDGLDGRRLHSTGTDDERGLSEVGFDTTSTHRLEVVLLNDQ